GHGNERLRSLAGDQGDGYKRDRGPEATHYRHRCYHSRPVAWGDLLKGAAGRAFSIGEIHWHETRRCGVPHGGGLSGRSRAFTTRYHVHGTAVGRARGARVALDGPRSPGHRGRPIGADPARRRERRLGRRDHSRAGARAAVARRAGARPAPLSARRQPVRRGGARGGPRPRRDRRYRRGSVPPHRRSGRAVRLARRLVRHTREGARAVAAGRYAGMRAAAKRLRSYCEIVREYPVSGRNWKSDPATTSMVAAYWLSFRVSATPIMTTAPFVSVPVTAARVTMVRGWEKTRSPGAAVMLVGATGPVNLN